MPCPELKDSPPLPSLAGQTFTARGRDGGAREREKRTSGHYRQVFVDVAGMLAAPIRLEIV